jgi:hypothetical protein
MFRKLKIEHSANGVLTEIDRPFLKRMSIFPFLFGVFHLLQIPSRFVDRITQRQRIVIVNHLRNARSLRSPRRHRHRNIIPIGTSPADILNDRRDGAIRSRNPQHIAEITTFIIKLPGPIREEDRYAEVFTATLSYAVLDLAIDVFGEVVRRVPKDLDNVLVDEPGEDEFDVFGVVVDLRDAVVLAFFDVAGFGLEWSWLDSTWEFGG